MRSPTPPRIIAPLIGALLLASCASADITPPVCDGRSRRPVNIYPSVLGSADGPEATGAPASGTPARSAGALPAPPPLPALTSHTHGGC